MSGGWQMEKLSGGSTGSTELEMHGLPSQSVITKAGSRQ